MPKVGIKEEPIEFFNEYNCNEDDFNYDSKVLPTFSGTSEVFGDKSLKIKGEDYEIVIEGNSEEDYIRVKKEDIKGANLVNHEEANCVNHEDHESFEKFDVKYEDVTVKNEDIEEANLDSYEDHGRIEEFDVKLEDITVKDEDIDETNLVHEDYGSNELNVKYKNINVKNEDIEETNLDNYEDHGSMEEFDVKFEVITVKDEDIEETNLVNYENHGSIEGFEVKDIIHNHNPYINSEIREVVQRKLIFENNKMARNEESPWPFFISQSKVPEGGMGVWTNTHLPKGLLFGPFEGRICQNVEPGEKSISNWLGYVNYSRSYNKTNLIAFQYKGEIYYKTKMDIKPETELIVWYDYEYRNHLRYILENKSNGKILKGSKEQRINSSQDESITEEEDDVNSPQDESITEEEDDGEGEM